MKIKTLMTVGGIGLAVASTKASTISYFQNTGTAYNTPALSRFDTFGNEMAGMDVWVTFSNGQTEHSIWAVTGNPTTSVSGVATVAGFFSISETGDTFTSSWTLQNLSSSLFITGFTLAGANGNTVFDRTFGNQIGTADSGLGKDLTMTGNSHLNVTYTDELNITGSPAVGDEFEELEVAFNTGSYFGPHASTTFQQDTDNAAVSGTIVPVPEVASTGMLLGLSFTALAAWKRRVSRA